MNWYKNKLIIYGIIMELLFLVFLFFKRPSNYLLDNIHTFTLQKLTFVSILLLLLFIIYFFAYKHVAKNTSKLFIIVLFFILFNLTLLFCWPVSSNDVFTYITHSRIISEHHANPYLNVYDDFPNDALYSTLKHVWTSYNTPYAPIFVGLGGFVSFLSKDNILINVFLFKLVFIVINFLCLIVIHKTFKNNLVTFLYAWNPYLLFEFILNVHNDILTYIFFFLSLFFLIKANNLKKYLYAWIFLCLSVLIKFTTLVFLPIFFLIIIFRLKNNKQKLLFICLGTFIAIIIVYIVYLPFGNFLSVIHTANIQTAGLFNDLAIVINIIIHIFIIAGKGNFFELSIFTARIIYVMLYTGLIFYITKKRHESSYIRLMFYCFWSYLFFLFLGTSWLMEWYFIPLIIISIYIAAISKKLIYDLMPLAITLFVILIFIYNYSILLR